MVTRLFLFFCIAVILILYDLLSVVYHLNVACQITTNWVFMFCGIVLIADLFYVSFLNLTQIGSVTKTHKEFK